MMQKFTGYRELRRLAGCVSLAIVTWNCAPTAHNYGRSGATTESAQTKTAIVADAGVNLAANAVSAGASAAVDEPEVAPVRQLRGRSNGRRDSYRVTVDAQAQVLALKVIKPTYQRGHAPPPKSTLSSLECQAPLVTAAVLGLKAKSFDDGLYAAVKLAADRGVGNLAGRGQWLQLLLGHLLRWPQPLSKPQQEAATVVAAAALLGGAQVRLPARFKKPTELWLKQFHADASRSKPLGFYTWNTELERIFRIARVLQTELDPLAGKEVATVLSQDDSLMAGYRALLRLDGGLSNAATNPDLQAAAQAQRATEPAGDFNGRPSLFPPARTPEGDLGLRLYGNRSIPPGFDLAQAMITHVRAGSLDLRPKPNSGWYDYQTFSLEPLVVPDKMPEAEHLSLHQSYRTELEKLFTGLHALTREIHVTAPTVRIGARSNRDETVFLHVDPELTVEPLPSHYLRKARAYEFIHRVLASTFGAEALATMHRQTASGAATMELDREIDQLRDIYLGAFWTACHELGMTCHELAHAGERQSRQAVRDRFQAWAKRLLDDRDLRIDPRMMVPVFYDVQRRKIKVWVVLGLGKNWLSVDFQTKPLVQRVEDPQGEPVPLTNVKFEYHSRWYSLPYLVSAELYVSRLMNRAEFRRHCDRYQTQAAILQHLR